LYAATRQNGHVYHDQLLQPNQLALGTFDGPLGVRLDGKYYAVGMSEV